MKSFADVSVIFISH